MVLERNVRIAHVRDRLRGARRQAHVAEVLSSFLSPSLSLSLPLSVSVSVHWNSGRQSEIWGITRLTHRGVVGAYMILTSRRDLDELHDAVHDMLERLGTRRSFHQLQLSFLGHDFLEGIAAACTERGDDSRGLTCNASLSFPSGASASPGRRPSDDLSPLIATHTAPPTSIAATSAPPDTHSAHQRVEQSGRTGVRTRRAEQEAGSIEGSAGESVTEMRCRGL